MCTMRILREYEEEGLAVTEYTKDGISVSHTVRQAITTELEPIPEPQPTIEEKLARMERQLEDQSIVQLEVLASIYEELIMKG